MIELFFAATPNGLKLKLFLEEAGLPYFVTPVSLSKGEQFKPEFLAISPNNKIPAIIDHAPAAAATGCQSSIGFTPTMVAWGTMPRMRELISR